VLKASGRKYREASPAKGGGSMVMEKDIGKLNNYILYVT
jgi:hypothetical protein